MYSREISGDGTGGGAHDNDDVGPSDDGNWRDDADDGYGGDEEGWQPPSDSDDGNGTGGGFGSFDMGYDNRWTKAEDGVSSLQTIELKLVPRKEQKEIKCPTPQWFYLGDRMVHVGPYDREGYGAGVGAGFVSGDGSTVRFDETDADLADSKDDLADSDDGGWYDYVATKHVELKLVPRKERKENK